MADETDSGAGEPKDYIVPGVELSFGGVTRVVPPLNLGALAQLQERIGKVRGFDVESINTVIDAVHAALKRNYRGVTRAFVEENLDTSNMFSVMNSLMNVSGLTPRAKELNGAGKTTAVEDSTGATSTAT